MKNKSYGWFPIISASALLLFWTLFAICLPMTEPYIIWVMDADWTWINTIGFIGSMLGIFAVYTMYLTAKQPSKVNQLFTFLAVSGVTILTAVLFFEAFILKGIALQNKELIVLNQGFYLHAPFRTANLLGGILFSVGMIGLGITLFKQKELRKWKLLVLMIGCPLFSIMYLPGNVRLVGVLLYAIGFIAIGIEMNRGAKQQKHLIIPTLNQLFLVLVLFSIVDLYFFP